MGRTYKIKLNKETKDFYRNMFLARKLQTWVEEYKALHTSHFDDDVESFSNEEIFNALSDKNNAKAFLSAVEYEEYLKYYDEIFVKESA